MLRTSQTGTDVFLFSCNFESPTKLQQLQFNEILGLGAHDVTKPKTYGVDVADYTTYTLTAEHVHRSTTI